MNKKIEIELLKPEFHRICDDYVIAHPEGTLFHLCKWKTAVQSCFAHKDYYLVAFKKENKNTDNQIVGVLPLTQIKSVLFGHYLVSAPFAELGGVIADDDSIEQALLDRAIKIAKEIRCDYLELKNNREVPGLHAKDLYYNFSREIFAELDENMLAIPRKSRAAVRKGIKMGLTASTGNDQFENFYEIMARSYHGLGTPIFPRSFFKSFLDVFKEDAELMVVRTPEGLPVAGVLSFYFRDRVMPYYAGSLVEHRQLCPNDFMYWELLKRGWERGFKVFDYGRSKIDTGSFSFKKNWGFKPDKLCYQYELIKAKELPNLSPANPKYKKKIEIWRKMPFGLTKIVGPPLAKYLG